MDATTGGNNVFSPTWVNMDKPVIVRVGVNDSTVSYGNLFATYSVEEKTEYSNDEEYSNSSVELTDFHSPSKPYSRDELSPPITRNERNGAFTFKENTEYDLMLHVQRALAKFDFASLTDVECANVILASIDEFCLAQQWMYHVGKEKGETLKSFLGHCIKAHTNSSRRNHPITIVELGAYCGYSAILLAKSVKELAPNLKFHVYSTEINAQNCQVANSMILMAKLAKYITVLPFQPSCESLSTLLKPHVLQIDFLLLDHAKDMYLDDLLELEKNGFIKKNSHVAADNVVFNRLEGYRHHVGKLAKRFIAETRLVEMTLEYSDDIKDGIGKFLL